MKKAFHDPVMDVVLFDEQDCIVTSNEVGGDAPGSTPMEGGGDPEL